MSVESEVIEIIVDTLQLSNGSNELTPETALLGSIPEMDSMAVVAIITALEENYGFIVDDDEIDGETFERIGSLIEFVEYKLKNE